jgi:hypothetical protein
MRNVKRILLLLTICLLVLPSASGLQPAGQKESRRPLRILFIGNSYTYFNNLPQLLSQLAASASPAKTIETQMIVRGGATLKMHWEEGSALKALQQGKWDYVVLQEQSTLPITDPAAMHKYARLFDAEIKKVGARTIFHLTWARQHQPENQEKLNEAYFTIARELQALVAPVGVAWQKAFKEDAKLVFHNEDKSHPNAAGSYMAAAVFYALIYGKSPEKLSSQLMGFAVSDSGVVGEDKTELVNLDKAAAALIQRIAWQTVKSLKATMQQHPGN